MALRYHGGHTWVPRVCRLFLPRADSRRPSLGGHPRLQQDPHFCDYLLFHEYFHGDTGRGLGASHQTGWTGLVVTRLAESAPSTGSQEKPR